MFSTETFSEKIYNIKHDKSLQKKIFEKFIQQFFPSLPNTQSQNYQHNTEKKLKACKQKDKLDQQWRDQKKNLPMANFLSMFQALNQKILQTKIVSNDISQTPNLKIIKYKKRKLKAYPQKYKLGQQWRNSPNCKCFY